LVVRLLEYLKLGVIAVLEEEKRKETTKKPTLLQSAKECAYIAVFVSLVIAFQFFLSFLPGVEVVTLLFACYAYAMGVRRGVICATLFSLLRQFVFGIFPTVLILYLVFYNLLCVAFALLGKSKLSGWKILLTATLLACLMTVTFTMLDNVITPLWFGYSEKAAKLYFTASLPFMGVQVIGNAIVFILLFLPISKVFGWAGKRLQLK
jgi:hypothetical protein